MRPFLAALALFLASLPFDAEAQSFVPTGTPWVVYGQTSVTSSGVTNPTPNVNTLNGGGAIEVSSLPYTVPTGHVLYLTRYVMEGYNQTGVSSLSPWIGGTFSSNSQFLYTVAAAAGHRDVRILYALPGGTILNVNLGNGQGGGTQIFGWSIFGTLD